jgi:hypothetical protein
MYSFKTKVPDPFSVLQLADAQRLRGGRKRKHDVRVQQSTPSRLTRLEGGCQRSENGGKDGAGEVIAGRGSSA